MSRKFYAVNRETGKRWKADKHSRYPTDYLVMYDSGYLAVVDSHAYDVSIEPLDVKVWKVVKR